MKEKLLQLFKDWSESGIKLPIFLHDSKTGHSSITLTFPFVSFLALLASLFVLHKSPSLEMLGATSLTFFTWLVATVLYLMRRIQKFKFDLDDKSVELDGGEVNDD